MMGDLHVHVSPPDAAGHSALSVPQAIAAARRAGLDFVVLTPHAADESRPPFAPANGQEFVRAEARGVLAREPTQGEAPPRPLLVVAGWEWTRADPGHLGIAFADVRALAAVEAEQRAERALREGALVVVNHPFLRVVASDVPLMKLMQSDRQWRPFVDGTPEPRAWNAIEVWHDRSVWIQRLHAQSVERFPETQMLTDSLAAWDAATLATRRRITAVGGSDAHGRMPYTVAPLPVTSVLVADGTLDALRRGLLAARVTFGTQGGAPARDFSATSDVVGERAGIGDALRADAEVRLVWSGNARLVENGVCVGEFDGGTARPLSEPGGFMAWRIEKAGGAYSNMIYANLPPD